MRLTLCFRTPRIPKTFEETWGSFGACLKSSDQARPTLEVEAMSDRGVKQAGKLGNYRRRRDNDPAFSQILQSARLPGLHVDTSLPEYTIDSQT